ncbi:MAG: D-2-hydroxyacid dehydrogenase [Alsobacter sp.]
MTASATPLEIVFLDAETVPPEIVIPALPFAHRLTVHQKTAPGEVAGRIAGADIVITNKVPVSAASVAAAPRLRLVAVAATGTNIVDVAACTARGVGVCNIRGYAVNTVPEHTFALILALRRSIVAYQESVARGRWQEANQFCYFDYPIHDLAGSTLGVIGDGVLGKAVARLGEAFGMRVLFSTYKGVEGMGPLYTPFEEVIRVADVITLHAPLTPASKDMIAAPEFAAMARRPLIVNTARGGLVNEEDLAVALETGQIAGAAFDVVSVEPPPANHPFMRLMHRPDFILTPHVAWASREAVQSLVDQLFENIALYVAGKPRHLVG